MTIMAQDEAQRIANGRGFRGNASDYTFMTAENIVGYDTEVMHAKVVVMRNRDGVFFEVRYDIAMDDLRTLPVNPQEDVTEVTPTEITTTTYT